MDIDFAHSHNFPLVPLENPRRLQAFDGKQASLASSHVTHEVHVSVRTGEHHLETMKFFVTLLGSAAVIFGTPWMNLHGVKLDFENRSIHFGTHCSKKCLQGHKGSVDYLPLPSSTHAPPQETPDSPRDWKIVNSHAFQWNSQQPGAQVCAISIQDIDTFLAKKPDYKDPRPQLPKDLHDLAHAFNNREAADSLPPSRPCDHKIEIQDDKKDQLPNAPLYGMSQNELKCLRKWLEENLGKGFIRKSQSNVSSPCVTARHVTLGSPDVARALPT